MEHLLYLLPTRPQPAVVRYGLTTVIVLVGFLLQLGVQYQSGYFGFFLFLPGIFLAAVLFDRGSGFYATLLSTLLSFVAINPYWSLNLAPEQIVHVIAFFTFGGRFCICQAGLGS